MNPYRHPISTPVPELQGIASIAAAPAQPPKPAEVEQGEPATRLATQSREAELERALAEADRKNDALTAEWNDALRKLAIAEDAFRRITQLKNYHDKHDAIAIALNALDALTKE